MQRTKIQISQSLPMLVPIIISGGLQDAYTYFCRDGVFANAQTGNIVFLAVNIVNGDGAGVIKYLVPVLFFALGVIVAKTLFSHWETNGFSGSKSCCSSKPPRCCRWALCRRE